MICIAAAIGWYGTQLASDGWNKWKKGLNIEKNDNERVFKISVLNMISFDFPGHLVYTFESNFGKTISPIGICLYVELVNNSTKITRLQDYKVKGYFQYDNGGKLKMDKRKDGSYSFDFIPSGKSVKNWLPLYSIGILNENIYYVANDWKKSRKLDFKDTWFELIARNKQLHPGESIMGWIMFEIDSKLRGQEPKVSEFEFELVNSAGEKELIKIAALNPTAESSMISSGQWIFAEGYYDLTKERYKLLPKVDINKLLDSIEPPFFAP